MDTNKTCETCWYYREKYCKRIIGKEHIMNPVDYCSKWLINEIKAKPKPVKSETYSDTNWTKDIIAIKSEVARLRLFNQSSLNDQSFFMAQVSFIKKQADDFFAKLDMETGNISRLFENTDDIRVWLLRLVKFFEYYVNDPPDGCVLSRRDFKLREFMYKLRKEIEGHIDVG